MNKYRSILGRWMSSFRVLLLAWFGLIYLWGLLLLQGPVTHETVSWLNSPLSLYILLMFCYGVCLWMMLAGKIPQRLYWLYFLLQGVLILPVLSIIPQQYVAFSLYLLVMLVAFNVLKQRQSTIVIACIYIIFFLLNNIFRGRPWIWRDWSTIYNLFLYKTDYAALLMFTVGFLAFYAQQTYAHAQLMAAHEELASTHTKLNATYVQLTTSIEQIEELTRLTERQRLARDLHDTLAQGLAGLIIQLQVVCSYQTKHHYDKAQQTLHQTILTTRETLKTARSAIDDLRTTTTSPEAFQEAVQQEIIRFTTTTGIPCITEKLNQLTTLPSHLYEHALRVIREGLTNIARHAQAHHVHLHVEKREHQLVIEVQDDGIGFDTTLSRIQTGHYGLLGLWERSRLVGGQFETISKPGKGTTLRFCFPIL